MLEITNVNRTLSDEEKVELANKLIAMVNNQLNWLKDIGNYDFSLLPEDIVKDLQVLHEKYTNSYSSLNEELLEVKQKIAYDNASAVTDENS